MKKCARCDFEYDDVYDGCPRCARETSGALEASEPSSPGAPPTSLSSVDLGSGSAIGALLALIVVLTVNAVFFSELGGNSLLFVAGLNGLLWSIVVLVDYDNLKKPVPPGFKIEGNAGSSKGLWAIAAFAIAGIAVPMYFYHRPRIKRAFELGSQMPGAA
jgi:hypothetical protein